MADHRYVSRGGLKLEAALDAFKLDVTGFVCVDLGCNVGGFTDCLLQRGASHVYAVDTGYGQLAWKLRNDDRVTVMERTNAMHVDVSEISNLESQISGVDLATIDLAWTRQMHAIPAAMRWNPGRSSR
jgi:23S rRNA (cytidine1920-2'-O)/16S rRNA (cytidine1409-2'-O)-methyltransferase